MIITNHSKLPLAIERAVVNDPYDSSGSDISTTRLIAPPRIVALQKKHQNEIEEDVADRIWSLLGQSVHHIIERSAENTNDISEVRLFYKDDDITNGWTLSGQLDYLSSEGELMDFKVTSAWSALDAMTKGKDEWEEQLNVLNFLCRKNPDKINNIFVNNMFILAILRDWSKLKVMQSDNYPKKQIVKIPIRLWSEEEQEHFIRQRILLHQNTATAKELIKCTPKEMWRKEDVFAVMKDGRKSALRLLPTMEKAKQYLKDNNMVENKGRCSDHRLGENVRCNHYCSVNKFCDQFTSDN